MLGSLPTMKRAPLWCLFLTFECLCVVLYSYSLLRIQQEEQISSSRSNNHRSITTRTSTSSSFYIQKTFQNKDMDTSNLRFIRSKTVPFQTHLDSTQNDKYLEIPERGYPKLTHLLDYETSATEAEIEKHDRLLVQGMYFMKRDLESQLHLMSTVPSSSLSSLSSASSHTPSSPLICINIYVCNRRVPYINTLLMSLLSFTNYKSIADMKQLAQIRLLNTEKRPERMDFRYMKQVLSKLPFVHSVHDITYKDDIYSHIQDRELTFRESFLSDEISGLKICIDSGLPFCLMMEEDSVVPVDFISKLYNHVIDPLQTQGILRMDGTGQISILSLYAYYNLAVKGTERLYFPEYAKGPYQTDYARTNAERYSQGMPPYQDAYHIQDHEYMYGTVAMFYTRESAIQLVKYLQSVGVDPIHNADEFMNCELYFPKEMGIPRKDVQPSLVNHIGYYSERLGKLPERGMFNQLNTDVRFMYDAGTL